MRHVRQGHLASDIRHHDHCRRNARQQFIELLRRDPAGKVRAQQYQRCLTAGRLEHVQDLILWRHMHPQAGQPVTGRADGVADVDRQFHGHVPLHDPVKDKDRDDQTVDRDTFGQSDHDQRSPEQLRLFGNRTNGGAADTGDRDTGAQ